MHCVNNIHAHGSVSLAMLEISIINHIRMSIIPYAYQSTKILHTIMRIYTIIYDVYYQLFIKVNVFVKTEIFTWNLSSECIMNYTNISQLNL